MGERIKYRSLISLEFSSRTPADFFLDQKLISLQEMRAEHLEMNETVISVREVILELV